MRKHKDPDDDRDVDYYGAFERKRKESSEMKHLTKEILDEDEKNTKRDLEHLNQICGHMDAYIKSIESRGSRSGFKGVLCEFEFIRDAYAADLYKIAEARKRLEL